MNTDEMLMSITRGDLDGDLRAIEEAVRERERTLARVTTLGLKVGDEVEFSQGIRPKYLAGLTATVVRKNAQSVVVDCPNDSRYGRFAGAKGVRCANALIAGKA